MEVKFSHINSSSGILKIDDGNVPDILLKLKSLRNSKDRYE